MIISKQPLEGAKCKVNWETACRPKELGGVDVLNIEKFVRALRLHWPWLEWQYKKHIWVGSGKPCTVEDMDLFYAATTIVVGDGLKTLFWEAPWSGGRKPKDIAPLIFAASKCKKWSVHKAMRNNAWIGKIVLDDDFFPFEHLAQFADLWWHLSSIALEEGVEDTITWKLSANGKY